MPFSDSPAPLLYSAEESNLPVYSRGFQLCWRATHGVFVGIREALRTGWLEWKAALISAGSWTRAHAYDAERVGKRGGEVRERRRLKTKGNSYQRQWFLDKVLFSRYCALSVPADLPLMSVGNLLVRGAPRWQRSLLLQRTARPAATRAVAEVPGAFL